MKHVSEETKKAFFEEVKNKLEERKKLISNYDYINWIENFTLSHTSFTTDQWLYFPEKISKEDYDNVSKLSDFHEAISNYCYKFFIDISAKEKFEATNIHIKYNNICYEMGLVVGQGSLVYIGREEISEKAIDFSDIVNNTPPESYASKKTLLDSFEIFISEMKDLGVPYHSIITTIEKYYK